MKNGWWIASTVGTLVVVGGVIGTGVWANETGFGLDHPPALVVEAPAPLFYPAVNPDAREVPDFAGLQEQLGAMSSDSRLGSFVGIARDVESNEVVWSHNEGQAVRPASATKILTAAAALYELGWADTITTEVVAGDRDGTVVLKAAGDVTMSREKLDDLATQLEGLDIDSVVVDTSIWQGQEFASTWDPIDVDAGYIAPIEPLMLEGGRIDGESGDIPRSHTPALDVAKEFAQRIGATTIGEGTAPQDAESLASVESETLEKRLIRMMEESDNVMAEGIAREVAEHKGLPTDAKSTSQMTLDILREHSFDLENVSIVDNSGLSFDNLITPQLLDDILTRAATETELRPLLSSLPIANATGTLEDRYGDLSGAGWVRAKTGTLTNTSALAGVVTSDSGRVFTFAFVSNDSTILDAREALDEMASTLRDF